MEKAFFPRRLRPALAENKWSHITRAFLVLAVVGYSMIYFNNTYPISEGWGINYAELMFRGKFPYRDFYYYLPPLNLWIDAIFWKLSFGCLIIFRGWYLAQRVLIAVLTFNLLKRYFHHVYAFIGCAFMALLTTGDAFDLVGDYNQTMSLLSILLLYRAIAFIDTEKTRKKQLHLFIGGLILGLMFLNKQTIFLASFLCYFACITVYCIRLKDKKYWGYCLAVGCGILVIAAAAAVYLQLNGALAPFVDQVFINVDGKGSLFHIIVECLTSRAGRMQTWIFALFPITFALGSIPGNERNLDQPDQGKAAMKIVAVILVASFIAFYYRDFSALSGILLSYPKMIILLGICLVAFLVILMLVSFYVHKKNVALLCTLCAAIILSAIVLMIIALNPDFCTSIYTQTNLFAYVQNDFNMWCFFFIFIVLCYSLYKSRYNKRARIYAFISCAGFSLFYAGIMASGSSPGPAHITRIALPFALCLILSWDIRPRFVSIILKGTTWFACLILSIACISQKMVCAYSWWGSVEQPVWEKTYTTDIPAMKGIRLSEYRKELYESVTDAILKNTDEDAVIWGYPHIKLFNVLTNRYNMNTFVPVLFYDVVSDKYVLTELEMLQENLPDIIVWEEMPNALEVHESVFRSGEPLKQREIEEMFKEIIPKDYTLLTTVDNVKVYKKVKADIRTIGNEKATFYPIDFRCIQNAYYNRIDENNDCNVIDWSGAQRGPYASISPGKYRGTIYGSNLNLIEIYIFNLANGFISNGAWDNDSVVFEFSVDQRIESLDIHITNWDTKPVQFDKMTIERIGGFDDSKLSSDLRPLILELKRSLSAGESGLAFTDDKIKDLLFDQSPSTFARIKWWNNDADPARIVKKYKDDLPSIILVQPVTPEYGQAQLDWLNETLTNLDLTVRYEQIKMISLQGKTICLWKIAK